MKLALEKEERLGSKQKISLNKTLKMILPYWTSEEKYFALPFLAFLVFLNGMFIYTATIANEWYRRLYDAIEATNYDDFMVEIFNFFWIAAMFIFFFVTKNFASDFLGFRWRKWLTNLYMRRWIDNKKFYRMMLLEKPADNPDQRIQQDLKIFPEFTISLVTLVVSNFVTAAVFASILYNAVDAITLNLLGFSITIEGYLLYTVIIYCLVTTGVVLIIGRPLVKLDFLQERYEANFRYNLVRVRERREEIATYRGDDFEYENLQGCFKDIVVNFYQIIIRRMYINMWQNLSINAANLVPIIAVAPKLFAGTATLGVLMQVANAFRIVEEAFNVIVLQFTNFAAWKASANRLGEFFNVLDHLESSDYKKISDKIVFSQGTKNELHVKNLRLLTPQQNIILENVDLKVKAGEKIVITGQSGIGKSTIVRTLSSIWPYAEGEIIMPNNSNVLFVPQKPYMPIGTLRQCLTYPNSTKSLGVEDTKIIEYLQDFRLEKLADKLDIEDDWSVRLSLGEQQRIAFIRILVKQPDWLFMDEPTASLDENDEELFFKLLIKKLKNVTVITVSHSKSVIKYHDREIKAASWKN